MNEVTVELIRQAVCLGIVAEYVLFDYWFSSPKIFFQLKQLGLSGLGMIKKSSKIYYVYRHRHYDIKGLYNCLAASKMTKKNVYLYASIVTAHYQGREFPLKVVFAPNVAIKANIWYWLLRRSSLGPKKSCSIIVADGKLKLISKQLSSFWL